MPEVNVLWEIAQALGLIGAAGVVLLCFEPVRPRAQPPAPISLRRHEALGWLILAAALAHVVLALVSDPVVLEHLRRSAPYYEWAGIVALLLLLALAVPARAPWRQRLWSGHRNFQAFHVTGTCLLLALVAVHVLTTGRYLRGSLRSALWCALSLAALVALLRTRGGPTAAQSRLPWLSRLPFGRHARLVLAGCLLAALALLPLPSAPVQRDLRTPLTARAAPLVLDFPHEQHRAVNCIECHHNFRDGTGMDACIACHRSNRSTLRVAAEARFHDFCLGCHRDPPAPLTRHGPTTGCGSCHRSAPAG